MKIINFEEYRAKKRAKNIVIYIDAVDSETFEKMIRENPGSIAKVVSDALEGKKE